MTKSLPKLPSLPKAKSLVRCACGCQGLTQSRFVPGHDSTLKGMRIRVERGLWDRENPEDRDAQFRALAKAMTMEMAIATATEMKIDHETIAWEVEVEKAS